MLQELTMGEIEQVSGGITGGELATDFALIGIGALAVAVAPVAFAAGTTALTVAGVGLGLGGAISFGGGIWLLDHGSAPIVVSSV